MSLRMIEEEGFLIENNNKKIFEYQRTIKERLKSLKDSVANSKLLPKIIQNREIRNSHNITSNKLIDEETDYFKELEMRKIKSLDKVKKDKMVNLMDEVKEENEKENKGYDFESHFISDKKFRLPKIYKPPKKQKIVSNSETMFPNLYKKKKVVYDDFSKIYLTNIKKIKEEEITEDQVNDLSRDGFVSTANNPIINLNLNNTSSMKQQTNGFGRETIKNSFLYSFRDKFKKQKTIYNNKPKNKAQSSPVVNCNTLYDIDHANFDSSDNMHIMTNYVSIC